MKQLTAARARRLLGAMRGTHVLVVGDVMLDEFLWGKVARISPEAPVPVVEVTDQSFRLGGAANVAENVRGLGGAATLVGVVGGDEPGRRVRELLQDSGVVPELAVAPDHPTTVKTRIIAHQQQVVRADRERAEPIAAELERDLVARVRRALPGSAAVVVSDYQKGLLTRRVLTRLVALARAARVPVLVDPKVQHFRLYKRVTAVTPNQAEAEQATGIRIRTEADLAKAGVRILRLLACQAALITRGEHGMSLFRRGARPLHVPTAAREVFDVTGAGDTVVATLALALGAGASLADAAVLANHAAGVVVGKLGTASASPQELLAALDAAR